MFVHEREKRIYRRVILLLRRVNINDGLKKKCVWYSVITFPSKLNEA